MINTQCHVSFVSLSYCKNSNLQLLKLVYHVCFDSCVCLALISCFICLPRFNCYVFSFIIVDTSTLVDKGVLGTS